MAKFKFRVSTGYVGSKRETVHEIPDEDLEGLTEEERTKAIKEDFNDWMWDNLDAGWEEIE